LDAYCGEGFFDFFELERLDDGVDFFHFLSCENDTNNAKRGVNRNLNKTANLASISLNKTPLKIVS
jgi:hypothetical protein